MMRPSSSGKRNVHRQITGAEALFAGSPTGFVVLGANRLDHRDIATKRPQVRRFGAGLGETGGVENHRPPRLHPASPRPRARQPGSFRLASAIGNGFKPRRLQALAENINETRCSPPANASGRTAPPPPADRRCQSACQSLSARRAFVRVVNRRARQGLRLGPGVIATQPAIGQAAKEVQGIAHATLTQELPEPVAVFGAHGAQVTELRVRAVIARHQNQLHAALGQFHQALDAVAPIGDAAVQRNQDHLGVAQHFIDIQIDRGVVLHLHRVGQAHARVIVGQLLRRLGEQRQAGVAAAQDHQLGGGLSKVGNVVIRHETAGLGPEQVHGLNAERSAQLRFEHERRPAPGRSAPDGWCALMPVGQDKQSNRIVTTQRRTLIIWKLKL